VYVVAPFSHAAQNSFLSREAARIFLEISPRNARFSTSAFFLPHFSSCFFLSFSLSFVCSRLVAQVLRPLEFQEANVDIDISARSEEIEEKLKGRGVSPRAQQPTRIANYCGFITEHLIRSREKLARFRIAICKP